MQKNSANTRRCPRAGRMVARGEEDLLARSHLLALSQLWKVSMVSRSSGSRDDLSLLTVESQVLMKNSSLKKLVMKVNQLLRLLFAHSSSLSIVTKAEGQSVR